MKEQDYINTKALGTVTAAINVLRDLTHKSLSSIIKEGENKQVMGTLYEWQGRLLKSINIDDNEPSSVEKVILEKYNLSFKELSIDSRKPKYVKPRLIAMYLLDKYTDLNQDSIGLLFNKDHSAVSYAKKTVSNLSYSDVSYRNNIERLEEKLNKL